MAIDVTYSMTDMTAGMSSVNGRLAAVEATLAGRECQCIGVTLSALLALGGSIDVPLTWPIPFATANYNLRISQDAGLLSKGAVALKAGTKTATGFTVTISAIVLLAANTPVAHVTGWV